MYDETGLTDLAVSLCGHQVVLLGCKQGFGSDRVAR